MKRFVIIFCIFLFVIFTVYVTLTVFTHKHADKHTKKLLPDNQGKDNLYLFRDNEYYGYLDNFGDVVLKAQYVFAYDFVDGMALVATRAKDWRKLTFDDSELRWGFINYKGKYVIPATFSYANNFTEGIARVTNINGERFYINKSGERVPDEEVIDILFSTSKYLPKQLSGGGHPMPDPPPDEWTYINKKGEFVTELVFEDAKNFVNGLAVVKNNGKYGVINMDFELVIDYDYDILYFTGQIDKDFIVVKISTGKWGVIDSSGKVHIDFTYDYIGRFSDSLIPVMRNINGALEGFYIDLNEEVIIEPMFSVVNSFVNGYACVKDKEVQKYGVIDCSGNYVIEPIYYYLKWGSHGVLLAEKEKGSRTYYIPRSNFLNENAN
jgi:hypothetical protein